jgi:hypothetical protein
MRERWRKVRGWPHQISDRGRARSLRRVLADGRTHGGGLLAQTPDKDGYLTVHLVDGDREWRVPVHVLVATYFPCFEGLEVRHLNGQRDNGWKSLRWGTHRENERDKRSQTLTVRSGSERANGQEEQTEDRNRRGVSPPFRLVTSVAGDVAR